MKTKQANRNAEDAALPQVGLIVTPTEIMRHTSFVHAYTVVDAKNTLAVRNEVKLRLKSWLTRLYPHT